MAMTGNAEYWFKGGDFEKNFVLLQTDEITQSL